MRFRSWGVADDTETDKRNVEDMANLCYGCTFHIHCQSVWIVSLYRIQFCACGNETVASANQAGHNSYSGLNLQCLFHK